jgi:hypothetical protein
MDFPVFSVFSGQFLRPDFLSENGIKTELYSTILQKPHHMTSLPVNTIGQCPATDLGKGRPTAASPAPEKKTPAKFLPPVRIDH